jgi:GAF domain-containing protein
LEPKPLRLADLGAHSEAYGFTPNHPPMGSFLGVPIRVRGQVFGNLYLTDKNGAAEFSEEDEILAVALGGAAGVAIENTRLRDGIDFAANRA